MKQPTPALESATSNPWMYKQKRIGLNTYPASRRYKLKNNLTLSQTIEHEQNYQHKN